MTFRPILHFRIKAFRHTSVVTDSGDGITKSKPPHRQREGTNVAETEQ